MYSGRRSTGVPVVRGPGFHMRILISGSTGLVGSALCRRLPAAGHDVVRLVRSDASSPGAVAWDPAAGVIDRVALAGVDAAIHLAGAPIAAGRWNRRRMQAIRDSRVMGTQLLSSALAGIDRPPHALLCASAIGYYGDRGDALLTEDTPRGQGFLAEVCAEWEAAADPARAAGIRVAHMRLGLVLSERGGALRTMLTPFKLGLGGVVGGGAQFWSWIALDDVVGAVEHLLDHQRLSGPVNLVTPQPQTNRSFTRTLGRVLRRPTFLPLPALGARLILGRMADATLLASARVLPGVLLDGGYAFRWPELEPALRAMLAR
jgi:hypothetical protein